MLEHCEKQKEIKKAMTKDAKKKCSSPQLYLLDTDNLPSVG